MAFLIREGLIKARNGYQSQIGVYQGLNLMLDDLRAEGPIGSLAEIQSHPRFMTEEQAAVLKQELAAQTGHQVETPVDEPTTEIHEEQMALDFAA